MFTIQGWSVTSLYHLSARIMWKLRTRKSMDLWRFDSDLSDQTQRRFSAGERMCLKSKFLSFHKEEF